MKIVFLGGIFDDSHNEEIMSKTKTYVEYAANNFQRKIIEGLKASNADVQVVSAPFLGAFPQAYRDIYFKGFDPSVKDESGYIYAHFVNIWGLRNPSRRRGVSEILKGFIEDKDPEKIILVYTPHTPLIQAANDAKRKDPNIKICLIIPDLPQYMNLSTNISPIYKVLKKYDVRAFMKASKSANSYVVLTEQMTEVLEVGNRPYAVVEGIYEKLEDLNPIKESRLIKIVYTGRLDRSFGIITLVEAFKKLQGENLRLIICGGGEAKEDIEKAASIDNRIQYKGQVSSNEARRYILEGDILVNPRQNNSEYTKYSFPSKIIDYISTGNPVIAYKLDGMPDIYQDFIYFIPDNSIETLAKTIHEVIMMPTEDRKSKSTRGIEYLKNNLSKESIGKTILKLNGLRGT